jgi:hypothetical protein
MKPLEVSTHNASPQTRAAHPKRAWQITIWLLLLALLMMPFGVMASTSVADAVSTFAYTKNMHPLGFSERTVPLDNTVAGQGVFNSDLAFWGNIAVQGTYAGFRLIDISEPDNPVEIINYTGCSSPTSTVGNQGDVLVWDNLLIRSWNSPVSAGNAATASCGGELVGQGFEGLNIFDISDPTNPVLVKNLRMAGNTTPAGSGSHTATLVPDLARNQLYVYSSPSGGGSVFDIVKIPLDSPQDAVFLRREPAGRSCHDTGVILGDVNLVACAGGNGFTVWSIDPSIDPPAAGSLEDPISLYSRSISGVTIGHSAAFTWDGEVLIFGHEPGGGGQAQCQAASSVTNRSLFFFEAHTGTLLGTFVHPRPQTNLENCTWHNYNIVPSDKRYLLVSGNYQSGISVIDFTDPAAAHEVAYADPAPLVNPNNPAAIELGGDWSTYWYNGRIYESDITRGLIIWNLSDNVAAGAMKFDHLNPQTQMISFPFKGTAFGRFKAAANQQGFVVFGESAPDDESGGGGEVDFGGEDDEH